MKFTVPDLRLFKQMVKYSNSDERGANKEEIQEVINSGFSIAAKYGRHGKAKVFEFKKRRHNKFYE